MGNDRTLGHIDTTGYILYKDTPPATENAGRICRARGVPVRCYGLRDQFIFHGSKPPVAGHTDPVFRHQSSWHNGNRIVPRTCPYFVFYDPSLICADDRVVTAESSETLVYDDRGGSFHPDVGY